MPVNKDIWTKCHNRAAGINCDCVHCHYEFMRRHRIARRIVAVGIAVMGFLVIVGLVRLAAA